MQSLQPINQDDSKVRFHDPGCCRLRSCLLQVMVIAQFGVNALKLLILLINNERQNLHRQIDALAHPPLSILTPIELLNPNFHIDRSHHMFQVRYQIEAKNVQNVISFAFFYVDHLLFPLFGSIQKKHIFIMENHSYFETGCCSNSRQIAVFSLKMSYFLSLILIYPLVECQHYTRLQDKLQKQIPHTSTKPRTTLADFHWYIDRGVIYCCALSIEVFLMQTKRWTV